MANPYLRAGARRGVSLLALAGALTFASAAHAQEGTAPNDEVAQDGGVPTGEPEADQDVIVTGTRASLQSAINRKRNADTVVDSIVAEDIASFPDKNVGEALGRITGVQLSRDFGEGTQVSIRGVEPDLNRVQINGVSQQSALGNRGGDFRELAVELVKSIDVYKGYTVDLPEGGIGGTVAVETRRPLDLKDPIFNFKAEGQRLDLTETWQPRLSFLAGRGDLADGRFGFILNVTHSAVDTRSDFASNTNWNRVADFDRSSEKTIVNPTYANYATYESCAGVTGSTAAVATANRLACETQFFDWAPTIYRYRFLERRDYRTSADLQIQYEFADNFNMWAQAQLNRRRQQLKDVNYSINADRFERYNVDAALAANAAGATSRPRVTPGTFTIDDNHVVTSSILARNGVNVGTAAAPNYNGANNIVGVQRRNFDYDQFTQYYQTGFDWNLDRLKVRGLAAYSKAQLTNNTNLVSISTGVSGVQVDRQNDLGLPVFIFPTSFDPADPNDYADFTRRGADGQLLIQPGPTVQYRPQDAGTSEKLLQLDLDYELDFGPIKSVEWGGQYRDQNYFNYLGGGGRLLSPAVAAVPAAGIPAQPAVFQTSANVSYNTVIGPRPTNPAVDTYYFSQQQYIDFIRQTATVSGGAPLFTGLQNAPDGAPGRLAFPEFGAGIGNYYDLSRFNQSLVREANGLPQIPSYIVDETIASAYLKFNLAQDLFWDMKLTGNFGVRYTRTRDTTMGSNRRNETRIRPGTGVPGIPAVTETVQTFTQEISLSNQYEDWLPAINLNLEALPNLFFRANYAKNLARPKPSDLAPTINCTIDLLDAIGVDDACTAGNPDLQPYRADQWEVNASWYPNADTLISVGYYYKNIKSFIVGNVLRNGVDLYQDGTTYTVRQPVNAFGAKQDGIEASAQTVFTFLPQPLDGFGASANFTYARVLNSALVNQATGEPLDGYPGLSKYTYNASLFYDKGFLNARVSWNKRTDWLAEAANANFANNPIFRKGESYIDAKILLRLSDKYSVWVEALNLGKEYSKTYIDDARPIEYNYPGQRIFVGFQFRL